MLLLLYVVTSAADAWQMTRTGTLTVPAAAGSAGPNQFGSRVAMSRDGNTLLVGEPGAHRILAFARSGAAWTFQAALQSPGSNGHGYEDFAVSADGTVVVTNAGIGAAVFTRAAGIWTKTAHLGTTAIVSGTDPLAINDAGTRIVVMAKVYDRQGAGWTSGTPITANGTFGTGVLGTASAISGDGQTILLDGPASTSSPGRLWTFTPGTGGTWPQVGGTTAAPSEHLELTPDGRTLLAARPYSAHVLTRTATGWALQTDLGTLIGWGPDNIGGSGALSTDGTIVLAGGPGADSATRLFVREGGVWRRQPGIVATRYEAQGGVAMSGDGQRAVIGNPDAADSVGHAEVGEVALYELHPGNAPEELPVECATCNSSGNGGGVSGGDGGQHPAHGGSQTGQGPGTGRPTISSSQVKRMLGPSRTRFRAALARGGFTFTAQAPAAGRLTLRWLAGRGKYSTVLAEGIRTFTKAGAAKVTVKLTRSGRTSLRTRRMRKITVRGSFTPAGQAQRITVTQTMALR